MFDKAHRSTLPPSLRLFSNARLDMDGESKTPVSTQIVSWITATKEKALGASCGQGTVLDKTKNECVPDYDNICVNGLVHESGKCKIPGINTFSNEVSSHLKTSKFESM